MNPSTLERLIIDEHIGELDPDVAELLTSYLAEHPDEASLRRELTDTVDLARQAVTFPTATPRLPELRAHVRAPGHVARNRFASGYLAAAAAVALAFFFAGRKTGPSPRETATLEQITTAAPTRSQPQNAFWSVDRLRSEFRQPSRNDANVEWVSPLAWPNPGDIR